MKSKCFVFVVIFAVILGVVMPIFADDTIVIKRALPEFRDISVWKSRTGLTLFSPDDKYLAVSGKTADVIIYETETGKIISKIDGRGFAAFSFSPDSKFAVAQNSYDMSMEIFEVETGKSVRLIRGLGNVSNFSKAMGGTGFINEINGIYPTVVLEMGRVPITKDWKNIAHDPKTGQLIRSFEKSMPKGTVLSQDQSMLVTVPLKNKTILFQVWETETGRLLATVPREKKEDSPVSIKWSPDCSMILTTDGIKNDVKVWSQKGTLIQTLFNTSMPMEFSSDGRYLVTGGTLANKKEDTGYIWEFPTGPVHERIAMLDSDYSKRQIGFKH